jgi:hypothetical protein
MRCSVCFLIVVPMLLSFSSGAKKPIKLFNQKDLSGWYAFNAETGRHPNATDLFTVDQQQIRMFGPSAGYLMSGQTFSNFRLTVEYRWNTDSTFVRKNNKKNSGIMYLVPVDTPDTLWPMGVQFQIKEGSTGDFILLRNFGLTVKGEAVAPGASVVVPRIADAEKPVGEWNSLCITAKNGKIKQELNGALVNEGADPSILAGRILLQYEGYPIDFRKVEVVRLK